MRISDWSSDVCSSDLETERLEVARNHLHRRDAARLHGGDEVGARSEGEVAGAPEAKPGGIGEVAHRGGAGRGDVDDAGVGQRILQPKACPPRLRGRLLAAGAPIAAGISHGIRPNEEHAAAYHTHTQPNSL